MFSLNHGRIRLFENHSTVKLKAITVTKQVRFQNLNFKLMNQKLSLNCDFYALLYTFDPVSFQSAYFFGKLPSFK